MCQLELKKCVIVVYQGKKYHLESSISLEQVLLIDPDSNEKIAALISDLTPYLDASLDVRVKTRMVEILELEILPQVVE